MILWQGSADAAVMAVGVQEGAAGPFVPRDVILVVLAGDCDHDITGRLPL